MVKKGLSYSNIFQYPIDIKEVGRDDLSGTTNEREKV
jgi:hypothetical protein